LLVEQDVHFLPVAAQYSMLVAVEAALKTRGLASVESAVEETGQTLMQLTKNN
jgi:hypothetical protein